MAYSTCLSTSMVSIKLADLFPKQVFIKYALKDVDEKRD
jgi:hypothetical protein